MQESHSSNKIRVLVADDHSVVREGTRRILEQEPDIEVVGEAADGQEAVSLAAALRPDVAIIDISMPVLDGIEATRRIKAGVPEVAILILTAYDDDEFVFSLLEAGVAGYLLKSVRHQELVAAVRAVHGGESVLHPLVTRKVINRFAPSRKGETTVPPEAVSERELEILLLAAGGMSNKDIAERLCISTRTVQAHLGHIFNKLRVSSRTEAVVRALREGWVTLEEVARIADSRGEA